MIAQPNKEVAFYYPGHVWHDEDWIKNLLLFFDGVGLLVPEYKLSEVERIYPHIAEPLKERGLLQYLVADKVVDRRVAEAMSGPVLKLIESGALDNLSREDSFHSISYSRLGYYGAEELAETIYQQLLEKGLARPSEDGKSIPIHPTVRYFVLSLLAQIIRSDAQKGVDLCPATDRPELIAGLRQVLSLPESPTVGTVVQFDLANVGVNLSKVPLDDVLAFRAEHGLQFRAYARSVRQFGREVAAMPAEERERAFLDRQQQLDDDAADLSRQSRNSWRIPASIALGFAGAAWTAKTGDLVGAFIAAAGSTILATDSSAPANEAFSYLLSAKELDT